MRTNLQRWRGTPAGRYVLDHMPASMQAVRALSALVMAAGGWRRSGRLVGLGLMLVGVGWSHGLIARQWSGLHPRAPHPLEAARGLGDRPAGDRGG